ncbi:hypothetical protein [Halovivax gelatinilyticus]|uniref:hypothetical protein n=1 Tax=Halovivax gelatinilyticus TaxID=2961597 RepID=UPI0020CA984A|nr:hypothetical protein [Halovivax gelatinilyticus]
MNRRTYLCVLGAGAFGSLSGCITESEADDAGDDAESEPEFADPEIADVTHPQPDAIDIDNEHVGGDTYDFSVEIQNNGESGSIEYTLVWLDDQSMDPWDPNAVVDVTHDRYFDDGERRTVSVTAEGRDEFGGYGFRLQPAEVTVAVENAGGDGRVSVLLQEGSVVVDEAELVVDAGRTESVTFGIDEDVDWTEIEFDVDAS